jgi:two-component SAPR family response regulator
MVFCRRYIFVCWRDSTPAERWWMVGPSNLGTKEFAGAALVIEDDALIALDLSDMLAAMGFGPVDIAHESTDAMTRISASAYAITIVDVKLEGGDGSHFIFASGYSAKLPADLASAPFVPKPFNEARLTEQIRSAVSGRKNL